MYIHVCAPLTLHTYYLCHIIYIHVYIVHAVRLTITKLWRNAMNDKRYKNGPEQAGRCRDLPTYQLSRGFFFFFTITPDTLISLGALGKACYSRCRGPVHLSSASQHCLRQPPVVLAWIKVSATCGESGILIGEGGIHPV